MSRTVRGSKPPGFEYWSKRPGNKHGNLMGIYAKKFTARKERSEGKLACASEEDWGV